MNKTLTVVIPTYNMEKYLDRCLTSLILDEKRLRDELEVLVVIDGAKDRSSEIAHGYQDRYPETFKVINKENGNYGSCINRGLKEATGKYFRILDADDWFDTKSLKMLMECLGEAKDVDCVMTNYCASNPSGEVEDYVEYDVPQGLQNFDEFGFVDTVYERLLVMHSITYKTSLLCEVGLHHQEGISYTDIEYCYYPLTRAKQFLILGAPLYQYFIGREGQTVSIESTIKHANDFYKVANRALADFVTKRKEMPTARVESLSRILLNPIVSYFRLMLVNIKHITKEEKNKLHELDTKAVEFPFIVKRMRQATRYGIHFYRLWKATGFRISVLIGK